MAANDFGFLKTSPETWTEKDWEELDILFYSQHSDVAGGFYNPSITENEVGFIEFRCHYDNYESEECSWYWLLDKSTLEFYQ